jgi:6,7-dimethyl-8-ribityllumazine synthase
MELNLKSSIPIIFCVLTDHNKQQSIDRSGGKYGNKGTECALAALKMMSVK